MHQRERRRQQPIDPGAQDGVRLSAADFHERPRSADGAGEGVAQPAHGGRVADVAHGGSVFA
jgi:hypothetical protein